MSGAFMLGSAEATPLWLINLFLALYAGSVFFALWVIDSGHRRVVPQLASVMVLGLMGFTVGGYIAVPTAIAAMACFTVVATVYRAASDHWQRQIRYGGMLLGLLAGVHLVPGINDVPLWSRWWDEGGRYLPFDFRLDKAYAGLLIALIAAQFHPRCGPGATPGRCRWRWPAWCCSPC
jgi:hypothetical protein